MSTYYYLACDQHEVRSEVIGGRSYPNRWWGESPSRMARFLRDHAECKPNPILINEHDDRVGGWPVSDTSDSWRWGESPS